MTTCRAIEMEQGARHNVPSPLVGEGQGGGDCRPSDVGSPPTPNPSPQGGGESGRIRGEAGDKLRRAVEAREP